MPVQTGSQIIEIGREAFNKKNLPAINTRVSIRAWRGA